MYRLLPIFCVLLCGCNLFTALDSIEPAPESDMSPDLSVVDMPIDEGMDDATTDASDIDLGYVFPDRVLERPEQTHHIVFVSGTGDDRPLDSILIDHLRTSFGFEVTQIDDTAPALTAGFDGVIISESVLSTNVAGKYRDSTIPVLMMEPVAWDDMGYSTTMGTADNVVEFMEVVASPITGRAPEGVQRTHVNDSVNNQREYGTVPDLAATAEIALQLPAGPVAFAFDEGVQMEGLVAPARRVGFGFHTETFSTWTTTTWSLFDASVLWMLDIEEAAPTRTTLLVSNGNPITTADAHVRTRLFYRGYDVTRISSGELMPASTDGFDLVLVANSASSADVGSSFRNLETGVVTWEGALLQESYLGLTSTATPITPVTARLVEVTSPTSILTFGVEGLVTLTARAEMAEYAPKSILPPGAVVAAEFEDQASHFVVPRGELLVGDQPAAGHRGYVAATDDYGALTYDGVLLFDAVVDWASSD